MIINQADAIPLDFINLAGPCILLRLILVFIPSLVLFGRMRTIKDAMIIQPGI
jgi:hypothetical protein